MADATTQVLSYALFVAISPIPLIAVVALLAGPSGRRNGVAFLVGWFFGLLVAGAALVVVLSEPADATDDTTSNPLGWVLLALAALMLWLAVKQLRQRPKAGEEPELPSWLAKVDNLNATHSASLAVALSVANPKNLILLAGAAAAAAETGASTEARLEAMLVFALVALIGPAVPVAARLFAGDHAEPMLARMRAWLARNNALILAIICLVIAAKLIADGVGALS
ncbi:MAG: GAP family protein [Thermoleophilaceae bacterium]|nr:GAP family protein [Thermoleophilaceae bacterium]